MATTILNNAIILMDDLELTGQANTVGLDYEAEAQDETVFGADTRKNKGGLKSVGVSAEGFFNATEDADLFADVGVQDKLITIAADNSVGDIAYNLRAMMGNYTPLDGSVGELASFSLEAASSNDLQRGQILFKGSATSSGAGSTLNAGAGSITAILHVFSASGTTPTLDVTIESDSGDNFAGAETTQISFTQATGRTAERKTAASTADTWWRVSYTIGGTNPDFGFAVILIIE